MGRDPGLALFRLLVRLYPRAFRARYGVELRAFFLEERARARRAGGRVRRAGLRFWARIVLDVLATAVRLRLPGRARIASPDPRRRQSARRLPDPTTPPARGGAVLQDLIYAARSLRRSPAFALFAAGTLALGVGSTTAVFSVLDTVVLRPLPYPGAERMMLVGIQVRGRSADAGPGPYSTADFLDLRRAPGPFEAAVAGDARRVVLTGVGEPERVAVSRVSEGYFEFFGARPAAGRLLAPPDDGRDVAVVSHAFWTERFGGAPDAQGRTVTLDDVVHTVVGVLDRGFQPPEALPGEAASIWVPLDLTVTEPNRTSFGLGVVARRQPGSARADGLAHVERLMAEHYGGDDGPSFITGGTAADLRDATVGGIGRTLGLALASVALLLVIACVNVAGLLLTRGTERQGELAIRAALGAGRRRLVRQLMSESVIVGLAGGALGGGIAWLAVEAFRRTAPGGLPRLAEVTVDLRVLAFGLAVSVGTAVLFGLAPAVQAARRIRNPVPGTDSRTTGGRGQARARGSLVLAETALAVVLAVGSGLMVHELVRLATADPGFRPEGLVSVTVEPEREPEAGGLGPFWEGLLEDAAALPGAQAAALGTELPFESFQVVQTMTPEEGVDADEGVWVPTVGVSRDYFRTLGIRFVAGRSFTDVELRGEAQAAVVNEAFVERYWPGRDGVRRRIVSGGPDLEEDEGTYEVVGVIEDVTAEPGETPPPAMYIPWPTESWRSMAVVVRTDPGAIDGVAAGLRRMVRERDPDLPVRITTVESLAGEALARPRFYTALFGSFGALALALAAVGIYGTTAYSARTRSREIGIRLALGADRASVVRRMVGRSAAPVALGVALGMAGAAAGSRLLGGFLYHVPPTDAATYAGVAGIVLVVGVTAALVPAGRASRVDPARTLREEG